MLSNVLERRKKLKVHLKEVFNKLKIIGGCGLVWWLLV